MNETIKTNKPIKLLLLSTLKASFIQDDFKLLNGFCNVYHLISNRFFHIPKIISSCIKNDIAYCWFATTYAFLAVITMRLLRKPTIIIVGGMDITCDKKLGYGMWTIPWKAKLVKYAIKHADKVIVMDETLTERVRKLAKYNGNNIEIIPTGYDIEFWKIPEKDKNKYILTVASAYDETRLRVKGIDILFESAKLLPNYSFIVIGFLHNIVKSWNIPDNVQLLPTMNREQLLPYYQQAKVYCQPSRHEGMSNALCEAMLCGCIPVATDVGATKSVLNGAGYLVPSENVYALCEALKNAMEDKQNPDNIRKLIADRYTLENREHKLRTIIDNLYK